MRSKEWNQELRDNLLNPENTARRCGALFKNPQDRVTGNTIVGIISRSQKAFEAGKIDAFRSEFSDAQWAQFLSIRQKNRCGGGRKRGPRTTHEATKVFLGVTENPEEGSLEELTSKSSYNAPLRRPSRKQRLASITPLYKELKANDSPPATCQFPIAEVKRSSYVFCQDASCLALLGGRKTALPTELQKLKPDMILNCCPYHGVEIVIDKATVRGLLEKAGIPKKLFAPKSRAAA